MKVVIKYEFFMSISEDTFDSRERVNFTRNFFKSTESPVSALLYFLANGYYEPKGSKILKFMVFENMIPQLILITVFLLLLLVWYQLEHVHKYGKESLNIVHRTLLSCFLLVLSGIIIRRMDWYLLISYAFVRAFHSFEKYLNLNPESLQKISGSV
jgi:hypothetical protein